jgi:hypothetical protein
LERFRGIIGNLESFGGLFVKIECLEGFGVKRKGTNCNFGKD